jgi:phosphoribosyl 1,2-cyclic phosphodiesterase
MAVDRAFRIRYWGATGSLTAPLRPEQVTDKLVLALRRLIAAHALDDLGDEPPEAELHRRLERHLPFHLRSTYGGNTSCVEIQTPDELIILDSGSGFRELGIELNRRWNAPGYDGPRDAHVLFTHAHMDHTYATPFVDPYYDPRNRFRLYGPKAAVDSLNNVLSPSSSLKGVYFPPTFDIMAGIDRDCRTIEPGESFTIGETRVATIPLNHPGGCIGYRFEHGGRSVVFASDHEQATLTDRALAEFARGAEVLYTDAQYTAAEYDAEVGIMGDRPASRHGWGHSTVEMCVSTAVAAGVKRLHLGHREPKRDDADLDRIDRLARDLMHRALRDAGRPPDSCEARLVFEGLSVEV